MKIKHLVLTATVVVALATPLFAGGQGEQAASDQITLSMLTLFGGGEGFIMSNLIEEFNAEHANIRIEEQVVEWGEYYNRFLTSVLGGDPPDIGIMHLAVLPDYASRGVLTPIQDLLPQNFKEQLVENIAESANWDGNMFAVPIDTHPLVIYYNRNVLREAGLADAAGNVNLPQTWDELFSAAEQVRQNTGKMGITLETGGMFGERWWMGVYNQLGGTFQNAQTGRLEVDRTIAQQTYEILLEPFARGFAEGPATYDDMEALFQNGQSAFHINGVWAMAVYPDVEAIDLGVMTFPSVAPGVTGYTWGDSHSLVFPNTGDPDRVQAALTFAQWFSNKSMEWAQAGHLPVNSTVLASQDFRSLPFRENYFQATEEAVLAPAVMGWSRIREEMWDIGENMLLGDYTPATAAEALVNAVQAGQR